MKKTLCYLLLCFVCINYSYSQNSTTSDSNIDFNEFKLSNISSPAFVLLNESQSEVYIPQNLKALTIHTLNNLKGNLSLEISPYFFLEPKANRNYLSYLGITKSNNNKYKQNIFSGINTTSISIAYTNKQFDGFNSERKVFGTGIRSKLIRIYNIEKVTKFYNEVTDILAEINPSPEVLAEWSSLNGDELINAQKKYFETEAQKKTFKKLEVYQKPIKPYFQIDAALGYGALFEQNNINSGTLNRFGAWLTSQFSLQLNKYATNSKANNYFNLFFIGRYIEDDFNPNNTNHIYRDLGFKSELEFGKVSFGYEYIDRKGTINTERSVGNIKYVLNKNLCFVGGFGKDFISNNENLVTLFGINWGLNAADN